MAGAFLRNAGARWLVFFDISMRFKGSVFRFQEDWPGRKCAPAGDLRRIPIRGIRVKKSKKLEPF
jgi:hypothetical protein